MLTSEQLKGTKELIDNFQPGITSFEKDILTPGIIDRLNYIKTICENLKTICGNANVAMHIDGALRGIVDPRLFQLGVPEPKVGEQYLSQISKQLDDAYINVIEDLLKKNPKEELDSDFKKLSAFYNSSYNLLQIFVSLEKKLFLYGMRSFLNVKNTQTEEIILGPPVALTLTLMPFQQSLEEMANVARTTMESITGWSDQIKRQKESHITIIVNASQVRAADSQVLASKYALAFQVAVIVFTIALVVLGYWANLFLEKRDAEKAFEACSTERESMIKIHDSFSKELDKIRMDLKACRTKSLMKNETK